MGGVFRGGAREVGSKVGFKMACGEALISQPQRAGDDFCYVPLALISHPDGQPRQSIQHPPPRTMGGG